MPVQKFRSHEEACEAREELWGDPGGPQYFRRLASLWAFAARISPRRFPPGVYRYPSIEAANRAREEWETSPHATPGAGRPSRRP